MIIVIKNTLILKGETLHLITHCTSNLQKTGRFITDLFRFDACVISALRVTIPLAS